MGNMNGMGARRGLGGSVLHGGRHEAGRQKGDECRLIGLDSTTRGDARCGEGKDDGGKKEG